MTRYINIVCYSISAYHEDISQYMSIKLQLNWVCQWSGYVGYLYQSSTVIMRIYSTQIILALMTIYISTIPLYSFMNMYECWMNN